VWGDAEFMDPVYFLKEFLGAGDFKSPARAAASGVPSEPT
jgi:hypothetical protein